MTAIKFLEQYEDAVRAVKRREKEYQDETAMIDAVRSLSDNDGMPHGSGISKPTENKAIRLADKRLRLIEAKLNAIEVRQMVFDVIDQVEGVPGDVLFQRHILLKKWNAVYKAVNYTGSSAWRYYRLGLARVEELISKK